MPRRRKRIGKLAQHGGVHSRILPGRFDEGYNPGDTGYVKPKPAKTPKVMRAVPRVEKATTPKRGLPIGELSKKVRMGPGRALQPVGEFQRVAKPGRPKPKGSLPPQAAAPAQQNRRELQQKERDLARRRYGA